jgi:hypothetical protein
MLKRKRSKEEAESPNASPNSGTMFETRTTARYLNPVKHSLIAFHRSFQNCAFITSEANCSNSQYQFCMVPASRGFPGLSPDNRSTLGHERRCVRIRLFGLAQFCQAEEEDFHQRDSKKKLSSYLVFLGSWGLYGCIFCLLFFFVRDCDRSSMDSFR